VCGGLKAFDTINYEVQLNKLRSLGVLDGEHEWFRNYLQNRTQIVEFQGVSSAAELVSVGVPQGSILRPLFLILHLNDLPGQHGCGVQYTVMYADDTVVFFSAPEVSAIQATLVRELQAIDCWFHLNSIFINLRLRQCCLGLNRNLLG